METRIKFDGDTLVGFPKDKTVNLIVLYSGGFDSTAILNMALNAASYKENKINTIYALNVSSDFLDDGKLKLEQKYTKKFISHLNKKYKGKSNIKLIRFSHTIPDLVSYNYMINSYDLIFTSAINTVVPFIGGADINIVLGGSLDTDSRGCHIPYYKEMVESYNKPFNSIETWMEFPLIENTKAQILAYIVENNLYKFCTCCEKPDSKIICNSCKEHALGLFSLLMDYRTGNYHLSDKNATFIESKLDKILGEIDD